LGEAEQLIDRVANGFPHLDAMASASSCCRAGRRQASLTFLPKSWNERLRLGFGAELKRIEAVSCARTGVLTGAERKNGEGHTNRVSREEFLSSSSSEVRFLIESIERQFQNRVKLVFGEAA